MAEEERKKECPYSKKQTRYEHIHKNIFECKECNKQYWVGYGKTWRLNFD